jgi:hypothetical protein
MHDEKYLWMWLDIIDLHLSKGIVERGELCWYFTPTVNQEARMRN